MGTWSSIGGSHSIAWFTEARLLQRASNEWRRSWYGGSMSHRPAETVRFRELIRPLWWALLHRFRLRRWQRPPAHMPRPLPDGWNGAVGPEGPGQVLYSRERGLVRVRGRDYALPGRRPDAHRPRRRNSGRYCGKRRDTCCPHADRTLAPSGPACEQRRESAPSRRAGSRSGCRLADVARAGAFNFGVHGAACPRRPPLKMRYGRRDGHVFPGSTRACLNSVTTERK